MYFVLLFRLFKISIRTLDFSGSNERLIIFSRINQSDHHEIITPLFMYKLGEKSLVKKLPTKTFSNSVQVNLLFL